MTKSEQDPRTAPDGAASGADQGTLPETSPASAVPDAALAPAAPSARPPSAPRSSPLAAAAYGGRPGGHPTSSLLYLAAFGIVYGDIGTSPLYAFRECFTVGAHGAARTPESVLGVLSMIFWTLTIVVSIKYLFYVMRADNDGEGGELALMALAKRHVEKKSTLFTLVFVAGLVGGGLILGDGVITPAISVLSAVEGLGEVDSRLDAAVIPLTIAILVALFSLQRRGTARVGTLFGPVMLTWFATLATLGVVHIARAPRVLAALWPGYAVSFFLHDPQRAWVVLGAVFLAVTGGEALYADMGHFGLRPIRTDWFAVVLPSLILNYFGQGANTLVDPTAFDSPFFALAPRSLLAPLVALSTVATVIASQAVISGVFSLARQATMLGYWPRLSIAHTSDQMEGQIYVPVVNWTLLVATTLLVLSFGSSSRLASAYGIAVSSTMVITTLLAAVVAARRWRWPLWAVVAVTLTFLCFDLTFVSANLSKIASGGYVPILIAIAMYALMSTWSYGRHLLGEHVRKNLVPLGDVRELIRVEMGRRVPGTAVFMTSNPEGAPPALIHNFLHNHVVHERVVLLTVVTTTAARVPESERVQLESLPDGFFRLQGRYGFMETPDVPGLLRQAAIPGLSIEHTTFFLGREIPLAERGGLASWRHHLFAAMARNSVNATTFFNLPPDRVMEIGYQLELE